MNQDRELLELAARAYWDGEIDDVMSFRWDEQEQAIVYIHSDNQDHNGNDVELVWNPLVDDGDALRLAVKLSGLDGGFTLLLNSRFGSHGFAQCHTNDRTVSPEEYMQDDPYAAKGNGKSCQSSHVITQG